MAIPANLWLVVPQFTMRYGIPSSPDRNRIRTEAALTYHVTVDVDGESQATADALRDWLLDLWYPPFANPTSQFFHFETITATHLLSTTVYEFDVDFTLLGPVSKPLPPQCAVLVIGRSKEIGHQVRRWLPTMTVNQLNDFGLIDEGFLDEWPRRHLIPSAAGGRTITPIIWNATTEIVRPIESIVGSTEWRTIRARSTRNRDLQVVLTPP